MKLLVILFIIKIWKHKSKFCIEEQSHAVWEKTYEAPPWIQWIYQYNKLNQTSTNNVFPVEVNIIFGINTNSSSADRKECSDLNTQ